jgi:hypothetical protein
MRGDRDKTASLIRELRAIYTPSLTAKEKRQSIRANARSYARTLNSLEKNNG